MFRTNLRAGFLSLNSINPVSLLNRDAICILFLACYPYFVKIKEDLCDLPDVCVSVYPPLPIFECLNQSSLTRYCKVLTMVYNTERYWVFGLCPSSEF
jgi:hypothetical protein